MHASAIPRHDCCHYTARHPVCVDDSQEKQVNAG
jgi:hypothetical protein